MSKTGYTPGGPKCHLKAYQVKDNTNLQHMAQMHVKMAPQLELYMLNDNKLGLKKV